MEYKRPSVGSVPRTKVLAEDKRAPQPRPKPRARDLDIGDIDLESRPRPKPRTAPAPSPRPRPKAERRVQPAAPQRKVKKLSNPDPIVVYANPNATGRVIMSVEEYKGKQLINIRHQYRDRDGDGWTFGKGCSFPSSVAALEAIAAACEDLIPLVQEE
jgi:hypothetical protein